MIGLGLSGPWGEVIWEALAARRAMLTTLYRCRSTRTERNLPANESAGPKVTFQMTEFVRMRGVQNGLAHEI